MKKLIPFKRFPNIYYMTDEIENFLQFSQRSSIVAIIVMFAAAFLFHNHIPTVLIYIWVSLHLIYQLGRLILNRRLAKSLFRSHKKVESILRLYIIYLGVGGFLWGISTWLAVLYGSEGFIFSLAAITLGISAGSLATLSLLFMGFVLFSGTLLLMQMLALFYHGGPFGITLGFLTLVFFVVIYKAAKLIFSILRRNYALNRKLVQSEKVLRELNGSLEQKVRENTDEILHSYHHDRLTGLPNLISCHNDIEEGLDNFIILFDISDFSTLNKQYGKKEGDQILIEVSQLLSHNLSPKMKLYKGESDRFVVYSKGDTKEKIEAFCSSIFAFFDLQEITLKNNDIFIHFNVGIADIENSSDVMLNSEYALSASKKSGSKNFFFYHDYEDRISSEKEVIEWVNTTKELIENDAIIPFYQGIKDIKNNSIYKYEVLARATLHGDIIPPFRFLEPARRMGLITTITRMMVSKSFAFFEHNDFEFSINITEEDLVEGYLVDFVSNKLQRHNIKAERVTFEILESINIYSKDNNVSTNLKALKTLGCKIALDDFGVENSNFLRLLELDFDYLKLDGIFIKVLDQSEKSQKIVKTIVKLSQAMDIKVIAEFVENRQIYELLHGYGVDFAQGFYVAKPSESLYIEENV